MRDSCYHCGETGQVDSETDFHDRLFSVAGTLAYQKESEYRKAANEDPDGDGYDLGGYENGMMPHDYFRTRVWDRQYEIAQELAALPREDQELLVAWNELPPEPITKQEPEPQAAPIHRPPAAVIEDDNIPF